MLSETQVLKYSSPLLRLVIIFLACATVGLAKAQVTWDLQTLIPEVISIRVPTTKITFDLNNSNYPPENFPVRYSDSLPEGELPIQIFSNTEDRWEIFLSVPDLVNVSGQTILPASQVFFKVNNGLWLPASDHPQMIYSSFGVSDWLEINIDFEVELTGKELAGEYQVEVFISAVREKSL